MHGSSNACRSVVHCFCIVEISRECVQVIVHRMAPLKKVVPGSVEWAQLEEAHSCKVSKFIESLDSQDKGKPVRESCSL